MRREWDPLWQGLLVGVLLGVVIVLMTSPVSGPQLRQSVRARIEDWQARIWNLLDRLEKA